MKVIFSHKVCYFLTCITEQCSKATKFALDVKYPPRDEPGNRKWKNREDSFIVIILSSNCDIGLGFSSFDISCVGHPSMFWKHQSMLDVTYWHWWLYKIANIRLSSSKSPEYTLFHNIQLLLLLQPNLIIKVFYVHSKILFVHTIIE